MDSLHTRCSEDLKNSISGRISELEKFCAKEVYNTEVISLDDLESLKDLARRYMDIRYTINVGQIQNLLSICKVIYDVNLAIDDVDSLIVYENAKTILDLEDSNINLEERIEECKANIYNSFNICNIIEPFILDSDTEAYSILECLDYYKEKRESGIALKRLHSYK